MLLSILILFYILVTGTSYVIVTKLAFLLKMDYKKLPNELFPTNSTSQYFNNPILLEFISKQPLITAYC